MIMGVEHGYLFGNIKCVWEEKWHPVILKFAKTQKATNKSLRLQIRYYIDIHSNATLSTFLCMLQGRM